MKISQRQKSAFIGAAGVFAVSSRLSLLEHSVAFPSVDRGVDILLGNGLRIQVKCGHFRGDPRCAVRYYVLDAKRTSRIRNKEKPGRCYAGIADFVIFWAIEENRFFVIPTGEISSGIFIPARGSSPRREPKRKRSYRLVLKYEEAWHLLDVDATVEQVAKAAEIEVVWPDKV